MVKRVRKQRRFNKLIWLAVAIVALAIIIAVLELTNTTHWFHDSKAVRTSNQESAGQNTKGEVSSGNGSVQSSQSGSSSNSSQPSTSQPGDQKASSGGTNTTTTTLVVPTGDFVSAHHVSLSTPISSVCNTTPGATCQITFTQNSVTKSLAATVTDRGGSAYWNSWKASSIGLTTGSWKVQAIATLDGQTQTAADALSLEVSQ
jgi:hypothetical protein